MNGGALGYVYGSALVAGLFAGGRLLAVLGDRDDRTWHRSGPTRNAGAAVALVGSLLIARHLVPGGPLANALTSSPSTAAVAVANALVLTAFAVAGLIAVRRGFVPPGDRGAGAGLPSSYRGFTIAAVLGYALAIESVAFGLVGVDWPWLLPAGAVLLVLGQGAKLLLAPTSSGAYRPAPAELRRRLADCYADLDRGMPDPLVAPFERGPAGVLVFGTGGREWLVANDEFLEDVTDEELTVALAQEDGVHRRGVHRLQYLGALLVTAAFGVLVAAVLTGLLQYLGAESVRSGDPLGAVYLGIAVAAGLLLLGSVPVRLSRQRVFRADSHVVAALPDAPVRETYERFGDSFSAATTGSGLPAPLESVIQPSPAIRDRIDRLDGEDRAPTDGEVGPSREEGTSRVDRLSSVAIASPMIAFGAWLVVAAGVTSLAALGVRGDTDTGSLSRVFAALLWVSAVAAPVGVYRARSRVDRDDSRAWRPSRAYYLSVVPLVNVVVVAAYFVHRWRRRSESRSSET